MAGTINWFDAEDTFRQMVAFFRGESVRICIGIWCWIRRRVELMGMVAGFDGGGG